MYYFLQYLSVDLKKSLPTHTYAHKPPETVAVFKKKKNLKKITTFFNTYRSALKKILPRLLTSKEPITLKSVCCTHFCKSLNGILFYLSILIYKLFKSDHLLKSYDDIL